MVSEKIAHRAQCFRINVSVVLFLLSMDLQKIKSFDYSSTAYSREESCPDIPLYCVLGEMAYVGQLEGVGFFLLPYGSRRIKYISSGLTANTFAC